MVNTSQAALVSKLTIPIASVLCEAFFFGTTIFPTSKRCDAEQGIIFSRGVLGPVCVRDFCDVVCFLRRLNYHP